MLAAERDGPVLKLTLNCPEVRNAFNAELIAGLTEAFANAGDARVVRLTGAGDAFCSGGDLNWMRQAASYTREQNHDDALSLARLFAAIAESPAIVLVGVRGPCFGGGCGLVAAADVAVAAPDAKFAFSEVRLGLLPATISPFVIPKIGPGHARALFATGEVFDAERALRIGLVHHLGDVDEKLNELTRLVIGVAPGAAARAKRLAQEPILSLEHAADLLADARAGEEGREGVDAFLNKRKAAWAQ